MSHGRIVLAPMEGVVDATMRDVLTRVGGYDWCVTEFARVSTTALSPRRLLALCPELESGARTAAGTPVRVQLLGSDPALLADSAALAASLDPYGIDLNFGCPAPTVNRHRGGAALLDEPELLHAITAAVRGAVPASYAVTAKMRLGIDDPGRARECAQALAAGGAGELVVHARTRADGYRHPARWEWIALVRAVVDVPVIANGDVWTAGDWDACRAATGCSDVMLGRGALADPFLARRLQGASAGYGWNELLPVLLDYWAATALTIAPQNRPGRLKQWLAMLRRNHAEAGELFAAIRELRLPDAVSAVLRRHAEARGADCRMLTGAAVAAA